MKQAVISCLHANLAAVEAVLADIDQQGINTITCLGDLVGYGPQPNEVVNLIRQRNIPTCQGCWDEDIIDGLNAWEQLKIFQKSFSDANSAKVQEEENRQKRKGVVTRQKGFEIEDDNDTAEHGYYETLEKKKDPKRLLASTDSEESTMPRKRLKKKKRRSQRRKADPADRIDLETLIPNCSESTSVAVPPPYRPPPKYRTLPRQVILGGQQKRFLF